MRPRLRYVVVTGIVLFSVAVGGMVLAESTNSVEAENSIQTPERTVELDDQEFTVTSLGYVDQGEKVRASVSGTGDEQYSVYLYNDEGDPMVRPAEGTTDGTVTIPDSDKISRGTYLLVLSVDGSYESVQPLVISGYDFDMNITTNSGTISVTVKLTGDTSLPAYVDIVLLNDTAQRYEMTKTADRTYEGNISDLESGDYRLYAAARSTEQVNGRDEVVGISPAQTVSIDSNDSETTTSASETTSDSNGGGTGGGGGPIATPTTVEPTPTSQQTTTSVTTTENITRTPTTTIDTSTTVGSPPTANPTSSPTTSSGVTPSSSVSTTGSVITPGTDTTTTSTTTPAFPTTVIGAMVLLTIMAFRRRE